MAGERKPVIFSRPSTSGSQGLDTPVLQKPKWLLELITIPLGGEHFRRRPLRVVQAEGFVVETSQRSKLGIIERVLARKPVETTS